MRVSPGISSGASVTPAACNAALTRAKLLLILPPVGFALLSKNRAAAASGALTLLRTPPKL